jgi:hypothetical protein
LIDPIQLQAEVGPIYIAGIQWEEIVGGSPLVNGADVLPLAPLTILFGANDSGKSSTLRVVAEQLDGISRQHLASVNSTTVVSFRNDAAALQAMLVQIEARGDAPSYAGKWALQTLADHPQLFKDSANGLAEMLAQAPVFALDIESGDDGRPSLDGMWSVGLVASPPHAQELQRPLRDALERLRDRQRRPNGLSVPKLDPRLFGHPLRPWHLGYFGRTSLPLVPRPLRIPQGVDVALRALEDAVERARRGFRAWSASVGLELPDENRENPWVDVDGMPDPFVIQLVGQLEFLSHSLLPSFVSSTYRLDFDPSSPVSDPGVTRMNARMSAVFPLYKYQTFAEKFRVDEIASGFQLWIELAVWEMVAQVDGTTASLRLAACDEIARSLSHPGSPVTRFEQIRHFWLNRELAACPTWLCSAEERAWQFGMLATAPRDPRIVGALDDTARAVRPRLMLIDEPERHLNAAVVKDAAIWLQRRAREGHGQIIIATHSPAFLACRGEEVRHVHVRRVSNGLVYTTFTPSDQEMLAEVAREMQLDHGELFGLVATIIWVEGPMDLAVLHALCGDALQSRKARVAMFGGLGNMRSILDNPIARLPDLHFIVLVDDLDDGQLDKVRTSPDTVRSSDSDEMRRSADLVERAKASDRQIELVSHGYPDIFFALSDNALAEIARRPWPGKDTVLRHAAKAGLSKSKLKGFVTRNYGLKIDEASCRYGAELTRRDILPEWVGQLLSTIDEVALHHTPL